MSVLWQVALLGGLFLSSFNLVIIFLHSFVPVQVPLRDYSPQPIIAPKETVPKTKITPIVSASPPVRLEIKSIHVDALITPVGTTPDGSMDIKENPDEVAWYRLGPAPGEKGSAVIAGHYGWKDGHASVFNNLHTLKVGDKITVYSQNGLSATFVVRETRKFDPKADATEVFTSSDGRSHLNLITCDGSWNNAAQSYTGRLVVFADEV